ncbi:MAG: pilus assembly protein PilM [Deltaproteobacteria bacterium]
MAGSWELCISIQESTYKFALCRYNKKTKKIEVSKAVQLDVPAEFANAKEHAGREAIAGLVKKTLASNNIKQKTYNLCISDRGIITRVVKLPSMEFKDLKNFMKLSIQQYFPIKPEEYLFDYKIQEINEKDEKAYYNVLLVAIPKSTVEYYAGMFLKCKMKPKVISIYSDAVTNLFVKLVGNDCAIMDMTYDQTEFLMLEGKNLFINSIINYAIPKPEDSIDEAAYLGNLQVEELGEDFDMAAETLKNYLNFFSTRHHGKIIEEVYFIGRGAMLKEAINFIQENLSIKVLTGEALANKFSFSAMPVKNKKQFHPERFFGCFGLLMRGVDK